MTGLRPPDALYITVLTMCPHLVHHRGVISEGRKFLNMPMKWCQALPIALFLAVSLLSCRSCYYDSRSGFWVPSEKHDVCLSWWIWLLILWIIPRIGVQQHGEGLAVYSFAPLVWPSVGLCFHHHPMQCILSCYWCLYSTNTCMGNIVLTGIRYKQT